MTDHELEKNLEELLAETGPAHLQAFIATNGSLTGIRPRKNLGLPSLPPPLA